MNLSAPRFQAVLCALFAAFLLSVPCASHAANIPDETTTDSGEVMPWESPLRTIATSLSGPVAKFVAIILIVGFGIGLASGQGGGGMRTLLQIGAGLSVAAAAATFGLPLLGFGAAL